MLSRITATIAERARNHKGSTASKQAWATVEENLAKKAPFTPADKVLLKCRDGQSIEVSRMALGTGSDGWMGNSNQTRTLGIDGLSDLLLHGFHEHGITCWDTADQYGSHAHVAKALKQVKREDVVVLTKTVATTADQMKRDIDRFRTELGTDYIDILLLHCMTHSDWPRRMQGVMDVISEACEEGIIRMRGVSCHSFGALKAAVTEPWVELDLARINSGGKSMDATPDAVIAILEKMKASSKSIMAMKVFGNGRLSGDLQGCLQFALGLDFIDCMTIGCLSRKELDETASLMRAIRA